MFRIIGLQAIGNERENYVCRNRLLSFMCMVYKLTFNAHYLFLSLSKEAKYL